MMYITLFTCVFLLIPAIELPFYFGYGYKVGTQIRIGLIVGLMFGVLIYAMFGDLSNRKWKWYILAIVLPIIYFELGIALYYVIFPKIFDIKNLDLLGIDRKYLVLIPFMVIINAMMLSFGALGEEIGWRTYLYPKLDELFGNRKAIIIGGIIWGVWHYPGIYIGHNFGKDYIGEPISGFVVFTIYTIAVGAILYYFIKKTGSVWVAAFIHAINNAASSSSVLGMAFSNKNVSGLALESPIRLLIISIPVIILGIFSIIRLKKDF